MSVKFEKEQVRTTAPLVPGGRDETTAHKIGEALTGGKQQTGYLAVRAQHPALPWNATHLFITGIPQTASIQSSPNQDADLWDAVCPARTVGFVARP